MAVTCAATFSPLDPPDPDVLAQGVAILSPVADAAMASKFLQSSADTPGAKHLFSPMVLHLGASKLHLFTCLGQHSGSIKQIIIYIIVFFTCKTKEMAEQIHDVVQEAIQQMLPDIMKHPEACLLPLNSYCPMMFIKKCFP